VVTGASSGLGRELVRQLVRDRGMTVLATARRLDRLEAIVTELTPGSVVPFAGDLADAGFRRELWDRAAAIPGGVDLLVNNAGLHSDEYGQPITTMGLAKVRRLFDVNVMGVVTCTLAAIPHMKGRKGASIVNISSSAAHMGGSAYGDSKLAVAGLTITFGRELAPSGIRVNAISPGLMLTETIARELPPETKARVKAMQWLEQDGAEQHIVDALLFLASSKAEFITGETLRVTGGMAAGV
jgi:NAD(P)-dependent dehydrogenase (short-subunit alcohol dehydrogenase family)